MHFRHERKMMTSETSENTIAVRFYLTLRYLMLTGQELLLYWACRQSFFCLQRYADKANGSMETDPFSSLVQVSKPLVTVITAIVFPLFISMLMLVSHWRPRTRFSKVPKLFGRISGDITLFVSPKQRRLQSQNLTVLLIFHPFATYEKASFTE